MLPYFIVFLSVSIIGFMIDFSKYKYIKYILSFILLLVFLSLYYYRDYSIGTDTLNYIPIFQDIFNSNNIIKYSLENNIEIGFSVIVYLLSFVSEDYLFIFSSLTSIIYINLIFSIYRYKLSYTLFFCSLFCVFQMYFYSFNILRQAIAISFVILAISYLINDNNRRFVLCCFLAFIFHYSSIFVFIFYFIYKLRYRIVKFWYLIVPLLVFLLGFIFSYVVGSFEKYSAYDIEDSITNTGGLLLNIFYIVLFALAIFLNKYISFRRSDFNLFLAIYTFYISLSVFYIISPSINQGMLRVSFYFLWSSIFIVLILIRNISNIKMRYIANCSYYLFLVLFTTYYLSNAGTEVVPYRFRY